MAFAEWTERMSVGSQLLDKDHKRLLELAQKLHEISKDPENLKEAETAIGALIDYTKAHFLHEETLMRRTAYPQFIPHKIEHDRLFKQIEDFRKSLAAKQVGLSQDSVMFLQTWLCDHMVKIDGPLGEWLTKNNLQEDE
jgi:hemerythrin-like metal-binding protein